MEHLEERRIIDIATRKNEPTDEELAHLKDCDRCRRLILNLVLNVTITVNIDRGTAA